MPTVKLNISLDAEVAETLRRRAAELRKPASRYLADLITEDDRRHEDELAVEGYRVLSEDTAAFAAAAWPLAQEFWPRWDEGTGDAGASETTREDGGEREVPTAAG